MTETTAPSRSPRLVLIRGNSGAGKSTLARALRERLGGKTALVEQDYLRRIVLREKDRDGGDNIGLIEQTVRFARERGYDVILEGIFVVPRYAPMLQRLIDAFPQRFVNYLDVPFEETLRRHATKPNAHEFGEAEMRRWWHERNVTGFPGERILPGGFSLEQSLETICADLHT